jgi:glutaredoxin 3
MPKVTIFSTPTCHYCTNVKILLNEMDVPFIEYNVATDMERRKEMVDRSGGRTVPVITVNDQLFVGLDRFREALDNGLKIR